MPPDPAQPRRHPTHPSHIHPHLLAHDIHALLFLLLQAFSNRSSFLLDNALPQFQTLNFQVEILTSQIGMQSTAKKIFRADF